MEPVIVWLRWSARFNDWLILWSYVVASSLAGTASIVGIGRTPCTRRSGVPEAMLAVRAVRAALADAGITASEVDGLVPYALGAPSEDVMEGLHIPDIRVAATTLMGGAGPVAGLKLAAMALRTGVANYVVVYVGRNGGSKARVESRVAAVVPGREMRALLERPAGMSLPVQWFALMARRYMAEYGMTREDLGEVALAMRAFAQLNPDAQMYGRPMTMDDYLAARPIAAPYHLLDCCLESDGAAAVVITTTERAASDHPRNVVIAGVGEGHAESPASFVSRRDFFDIGLHRAAPIAFGMAGLKPENMDIAYIYDCFTFEVIHQLEAAGFCKAGEGHEFVRDGRIGPGGALPVNTGGGLLSDGHLAAMNNIVEAAAQLTGRAGARQVNGARAAFVSGFGDMGDGTAAVLVAA